MALPIEERHSRNARDVVLQIFGSDETMILPAQVSTKTGVVREMLSDKIGCSKWDIVLLGKNGLWTTNLKDTDEVRSLTYVKGIKSFRRARKKYDFPVAIIGCGHFGLRQGLYFAQAKNEDYVIIDRYDRLGGSSWLKHANKGSKMQSELGTYQLGFSGFDECPKGMSPWPDREELLKSWTSVANRWGITPHIQFGVDAKRYDQREKGSRNDKVQYFELNTVTTDASKAVRAIDVAAILMFPGNLSNPRRQEYVGESAFDGIVAYGMFDDFDYTTCKAKNVAICGFGAFALENVRLCCENQVGKISIVCRRKNLQMPRMISWWVNGSLYPVSAKDILKRMAPVYQTYLNDDPWTYHSVTANPNRTSVHISQKARFGISDIYFLASYYGKLEVMEGDVRKLSKNTLHLESGQQVTDVQVVLKTFGFTGEWSVDKFLQLQQMYGFWVNNNLMIGAMSEFVSINASKFGGTSQSPMLASVCYWFMHFIDYPTDWWGLLENVGGAMPTHEADTRNDIPGYVYDARLGSTVTITVSSACPILSEGMTNFGIDNGNVNQLKRDKQWGTHSMDEIHSLAAADWTRYCQMFKDGGDDRPFPPYLFSLQDLRQMVSEQDREGFQDEQKMAGMMG